jgi:hypothetical protein
MYKRREETTNAPQLSGIRILQTPVCLSSFKWADFFLDIFFSRDTLGQVPVILDLSRPYRFILRDSKDFFRLTDLLFREDVPVSDV